MKNVSVVMSWVLVMGLGAALSMAAAIRPVGVQDWGAPHDPGDFFWITQTIDSSELDENENGQMDYLDSFAVIENQDLDLFAPELDAFVVYDLGEMATINNVTIRPRHPHGSPNGPRDVTIYSIPDLSAVSGTLDDLDDSAIVIAGDIEFNGISGSLPDLAPSDTQSFPEITTQYVGMKFTSGYDQNHGNVQFSDVVFDHGIPTPVTESDWPGMNSNLVDGAPRHVGSGNPLEEGFTVSPPSHPDIFGSEGDGTWVIDTDDTVGATLQRYQGSFDVPDATQLGEDGPFTFTGIGAITMNNFSAVQSGGVEPDPSYTGNTMVLSMDLNPNNSTNYENINFHWGTGLDFVASGHRTPDNGEPNVEVDTTKMHVYQYVRGADPSEPQRWDIYVDGELALEDVSSLTNSTGLDGHEGFLWGSVTRGREEGTKSTSEWQLVQAQAAVCIYGSACSGAGSPADLDGDGDVDFTDFSTLAFNFTGTLDPGTGGYTAEEGDLDGDEDVDFADFSRLAADFTGTLTAPASDDVASGDVRLSIDMENDGAMTLEASNASLAGYSIRSSDSQLVPDADGAAAPFMFYLLNAAQEVTAGSVGSATTLTSDLALDISFGGDADQAANVVFEYTRAGDVTPVAGVVNVIPEPASLILLAAGGLLVISRHRRSA